MKLRSDMEIKLKSFSFDRYTIKPANKGHPRERQNMVFKDKWSLFGGYFVLFIKAGLLKCCLYLHGGLYSEVVFKIRFDCTSFTCYISYIASLQKYIIV